MAATCPVKSFAGKASTVNVTDWPAMIFPMSTSSTYAFSCSRSRSMIVTKVGALSPAATVSPSWVETDATTPDIGARSTVKARSTDALSSAARARSMSASACFRRSAVSARTRSSERRADSRPACATAYRSLAISAAARGVRPFSSSVCWRCRSSTASVASASKPLMLASARASSSGASASTAVRLAWTSFSSAVRCASTASSSAVSSSARTAPFSTRSPMLARSRQTRPDTREPTRTSAPICGFTAPIATTVAVNVRGATVTTSFEATAS